MPFDSSGTFIKSGPIGIRIDGVEALQELMLNAMPKEAVNALRVAIYNIAKNELAPELRSSVWFRTGNVKASVKVRRGKGTRTGVYSDVYFEGGKGAEHDGFYWRFQEHGFHTRDGQWIDGTPVVWPMAERLRPTLPQKIADSAGVAFEKAMVRKRKRLLKKGVEGI